MLMHKGVQFYGLPEITRPYLSQDGVTQVFSLVADEVLGCDVGRAFVISVQAIELLFHEFGEAGGVTGQTAGTAL